MSLLLLDSLWLAFESTITFLSQGLKVHVSQRHLLKSHHFLFYFLDFCGLSPIWWVDLFRRAGFWIDLISFITFHEEDQNDQRCSPTSDYKRGSPCPAALKRNAQNWTSENHIIHSFSFSSIIIQWYNLFKTHPINLIQASSSSEHKTVANLMLYCS